METKELIQKKRDQKNIGGKTRISSRSAASSLSSESPRRLEDRLHETGLEGPMSAEAASEEEKDVEIRGGANASPSSSAARRSLPSLVFLLPTSSSLSFFDLLTLFLPSLPFSPPPPHTHTRPPPPQITGPQKVQGRPRAFLPARPQAVDAPLGLLGTLAAAAALGARRRLGRGRTVRPLRDPAGPSRRHARRRAPRLPRPVAPVPPGQEPGPCRRGLLRRVDHQGV